MDRIRDRQDGVDPNNNGNQKISAKWLKSFDTVQ
jgi:hypothetical protein